MKIFGILRKLINHADFFSTTELIRYREEPDFKTFTGGIFSIAIIVVLATIFGNMSLSAVRRENINWSSQMLKDSVPPPLNLPFDVFNIGVELQGLNLSAPLQYFDVVMTLFEFKNKILDGSGTRIPLRMCRRQDWDINQDILGNFDRMNATNWLCPDASTSFYVAGKWTSNRFTFASFDVLKCGSVNKNAVCANDSVIEQMLLNIMHFSVYYVNALIAPEDQIAVTYYLEDKDYIYFGKNLGSANYIFISDYQILTDHSILPYTDTVLERGGIVMLPTTISIQEVSRNWFASFIFRKSTNRYVFYRAFTKFDTVISYIGGLFGAIIGVLFLMNHYTRTNFEISLGSSIYENNEEEDENAEHVKSLNFCNYLGYLTYIICLGVGCKPQWPTYERFHRYRTEVQKHLDIKLILEKLNFLERSLCTVCGQDRFKAMHLKGKMTLAEAQRLRQLYYMRAQIISLIIKRKKEKKMKEIIADIVEMENGQKSVGSPNILNKSQPFFLINKGNKIMPQESSEISEVKNVQVQVEPEVRAGDSDSHNTMKFTKTTRRFIADNKSLISEDQHFPEDDLVLTPELMDSLLQVWKQALNGDTFSQQLWNNLDYDVKLIVEKKLQKHNNLLQQDSKSSESQLKKSEEEKNE